MLTIAGLWPRCSLLGPNRKRLPPEAAARAEVAITIDDGPEPEGYTRPSSTCSTGTSVTATFFCIGERATAPP